VRTKKAGEVEYIKSGINHQLSNTGKLPARFIVVLFN
jgi:quercetin dioxygenase-like cupin family protein